MAFSVTVKEAAAQLGVSVGRVHQLIKSGALSAEKMGSQWVIDGRDVAERLASKPRSGRPAAQEPPDVKRYVLMNRTHEVLGFTHSLSANRFLGVFAIYDSERAPLSIASPRGTAVSVRALDAWWRHRSIPASREGIDAKLRELGLDDPPQIPFESLGLSLSDQYWIRPDGVDVSWEDVNFFSSPFPEMNLKPAAAGWGWLSEVGLDSPDNTSDGMLPKRWVRQGKKTALLKGAGPLGQEPYNEVVATALHRRLLPAVSFVPYELAQTAEGVASRCGNFLSNREEYVPAFAVRQLKRKPNHFSDYQHYVDCCASVGVEDAAQALDRMIVCDDILANHDRHWRNFGLVRDVETLECRVAPLFDSGSSLWCDVGDERLRAGEWGFDAKPFYEDPNRQFRLVNDLTWLDPRSLDGFVEEARAILAPNAALGRRLDAICNGIQFRIDRLLRQL